MIHHLSSESATQNRLVLSQRTSFKAALSALHEFERAALLLHTRALIKLLLTLAERVITYGDCYKVTLAVISRQGNSRWWVHH